jgi:hypothetical protein
MLVGDDFACTWASLFTLTYRYHRDAGMVNWHERLMLEESRSCT